jgi:transcriptional regulator with XRE-family HTH domain
MNYSIEKIINDIKRARKNKQLSQRELSAKTGIAQSHISKIENGAIDITLSTLVELARALDLEVTLVPRKIIPVVQSLIRASLKPDSGESTQPKPAYSLDNIENG